MKKVFLVLIFFFVFINNVLAIEDITPKAKSAILIESSTGNVLYEKNSHEKLPPASMTKVMSMLLIMETIENGNISLDDEVLISENAASMGGSQVYLSAGEKYKVDELLKGIAVASGNDAVVAMAEKISGTVEAFVKKMNKRAKELGMNDTVYKNPHGLDEEGHVTTAYDMSIVARELVKHEKILEYTSLYEYYMKKQDNSTTWLVNTNKLVRFFEGLDGLKTGFTEKAKYCLTATAKKNDMRLISVIMGEESSEERSNETVKLLNYGFNTYKLNVLMKKNTKVDRVLISNSVKEIYDVVLKEDATYLMKNDENNKKINYKIDIKNITAPIKKGDIVGNLLLLNNNTIIKKVPLIINEDVKKATFLNYLKKNFKLIILGKTY